MQPNGEQRAFPGNIGGTGQGRQNSNAQNRLNMNIPGGQVLVNNNLIVIGVLSLVLIGAIIFAARFKKSY